MAELSIRAVQAGDRERVWGFIRERWGAEIVVGHGQVYYPHTLPGFIAVSGGEWAGLLTYHIDGTDCEIVTLDAVDARRGVGTLLIDAVRAEAIRRGCRRLWVMTTNDNLEAMRFYQRRGFRLAAARPGAIEVSRRLKPSIPEVGLHGIPIRDELDFELALPDA